MLALVLVKALDVHIEERGRVHRDAAISLDDASQIDLVRLLDVQEISLELRVFGVRLKSAKFVKIAFPVMPDLGGDELAQPRITG